MSDRADEGGIMRGCRVSQREVNALKVSWSSALLTWRKSAVQRRVSLRLAGLVGRLPLVLRYDLAKCAENSRPADDRTDSYE